MRDTLEINDQYSPKGQGPEKQRLRMVIDWRRLRRQEDN